MPAPIVIGDLSGLGRGIAGAGSALAQALQQRNQYQRQQQQQQKYNSILNQTLGGLSPEASPMEIMAAGRMAIAQGAPPDVVNQSMQMYKPQLQEYFKAQSQLQSQRQLLSELGIFSGPTGQTYGDSAEQLQVSADRSGGNLSRFSDDQLIAMQAIPKLKDFAKAELDRRENVNKKEKDLWDYKPTQKYLETIESEAKDAEFLDQVSREVENLVKQGNVDPKNMRVFLASQFGEKIPFLFSEDTAKLKFLEKLQAKGLKNYFPRPTEREFFFMNAAQAQLGKSNEANLAIAQLQRKFDAIPIKAAEYAQEVIQENGGAPPRDLPRKVSEKMKSFKKELIDDSAKIVSKYGSDKEKKAADLRLGKEAKEGKSVGNIVKQLPMTGIKKGTKATDQATGEIFIFDGIQWNKQ